MLLPTDDVTGYRDWLLARTRRVQRGLTVSAVVAAIGLSAAFAHALPGHSTAARQAAAVPLRHGSGGKAAPSAGHHHAGHHHAAHHRHHRPLQPPAQPPATAPATPAPVTSGGS